MENLRSAITVYITNYNYGKYIDQAIKSVLSQTFKDFELIIIDDGSKDNSKKIIDKYKTNKKIRIIYQKNRGLNISNNIALKLSKGKYIIRLDADDWFDNHALEILYKSIEKDNKIGLVFPDYFEVDEQGDIINITRRHDFKKVTLRDQAAHGACTLIRTEFLKKMGGYNESFSRQDGYDVWVKFIDKYHVKNINLPLFYYRQHTGSLSKNTKKLLSTRSEILKRNIDQKKLKKKKGLAIIPVRGLTINPNSFVLKKLGKKPLLNWSIDILLRSSKISKVIVTTPDQNIIDYLKKKYKNKIIALKRDEQLGGINVPIEQTIINSVNFAKKLNIKFDYIFEISYKNPFLTVKDLETSINLLEFFKTDQVISVLPENNMFSQHHGNGLKPIKNFHGLKLEREDIFRDTGSIRVVRKKFKHNSDRKIKKIGHLATDEKSSFTINTNLDFLIAQKVLTKKI